MKIDLLGVKINAEPKETILKEIAALLQKGRSILITTPYSESIVAAQKDEEFRNVLNSADFALPDGIGLLWAAKYLILQPTTYNLQPLQTLHALWQLFYSLLAIVFYPAYIRRPIPEKISGSELIWDLAALAEQKGYSIFLLGGFGDTPAVVAEKLKSLFPNLRIAGTSSGLSLRATEESAAISGITSFSDQGRSPRNDEIIQQINASHTDFLLVALGPIRQEKWLCDNLPKLRVKLAIGVGGTFDYIARIRAYRPNFWASRGLEWLWRLLTQPWRAGRIFRGVGGLVYYSFRFKIKKL